MSTLYVDNLEPNLGSRVLAAGHVVQYQRFEPSPTSTTPASPTNGRVALTTSNTTSVWTAAFTPTSSDTKIIGVYQSQEDVWGTGGWTMHSCFVGSTLIGSSMRYCRYNGEEPYTQSFTFEYDHNTSSQITFDMRYGSTNSVLILLNRSYSTASGGPLEGSTSLHLMEIAQ